MGSKVWPQMEWEKSATFQPKISKCGEEYTTPGGRIDVKEPNLYLEVTINLRAIAHDEIKKRLDRAIRYARRMKGCSIHERTTNSAIVLEAC